MTFHYFFRHDNGVRVHLKARADSEPKAFSKAMSAMNKLGGPIPELIR